MSIPTAAQILSWMTPDTLYRMIVIYFFVVWFCIVIWVVRDITNRSRSVVFQIFSILLVLFLTPLGIFVYLLIRPQKTLFEQVFESEFLRLDEEYQAENRRNHAKAAINGMDIERKRLK